MITGVVKYNEFEYRLITRLTNQSFFHVLYRLQRNQEQKTSLLLEFLPSKGKFGIDQFIDYLSAHYSWLADPIKSYIENKIISIWTKKLRPFLTSGEVPHLSSTHVTRTDHVCYSSLILVVSFV